MEHIHTNTPQLKNSYKRLFNQHVFHFPTTQTMTIGQMLHQWLTKLEWFSTLFPRIPVPIQKQIESKINNYCQQNNVNFAAPSVSQAAPIEPEKNRQEWREKSAERKRGRDRSRERQQSRNDDRYESRRGYGSKSKEREREYRHR